jgi:hypothetical protein
LINSLDFKKGGVNIIEITLCLCLPKVSTVGDRLAGNEQGFMQVGN